MAESGKASARRSQHFAWCILLALLFAASGRTQELPATLLADQVTYDRATGLLVASGNVEVLYGGRVLSASRIVYDERKGEIGATGPIVLTDPERGVFLAGSAALTPDLRDGLISSAQLLISNQLQLSATEVRRVAGRYTTLYRTVASSCTICSENPTPTWAIRAARITQDTLAQRIYFEDATLELFGLPMGYLPRLSIPDPSLTRASGFLAPDFSRSQIYGYSVKLPYYRVLGPSADATLTPFITSYGGVLMEAEYRRRFRMGGFDISGVVSLEDGLAPELGGDAGRGAISAEGAFELGRGFVAAFDLNVTSDDDFLQQFDYSDADRLTSTARIARTREKDHLEIGSIAFQSLRPDENTGSIPFILPEFTFRRILENSLAGGRLALDLQALGVLRDLGDDVVRAGGGVDWRRGWSLGPGLLTSVTAGADLDAYRSWDRPNNQEEVQMRASPDFGVEVRWPLVRREGAVDHVIEPIIQVLYTDLIGDQDVPNEDSQLPEFDETNLFRPNRFPGQDRIENGLRANLGVNYTRYDPAGWDAGFTLGRVLRDEAEQYFTGGSAVPGGWSDYVGAFSVDFAWGLSLLNRSLFDDSLSFRRNEFAVGYDGQRGGLRASYVYLAATSEDPFLGPQSETSEFTIDTRYRLRPNWEVRTDWRYDFAADRNIRAGGGITYGNECAEFDLSASRRYTSSSNVPPSTSIGFSVRLANLGGSGKDDWPARICAGTLK